MKVLKSPTISLNLASGVLACKGRLFNEQVRTLPGTQVSGVGKVVACLVPLPQCRCLSEMWPPEEHLDMETRPQPYCSELRDKGEMQPAPVPGWWTHSDLLLRVFTAASCPSASSSLLLTARGEC